MHIRGVPRDQTVLFPERIEDYVAADNPVRVIDAFIRSFTDHEWAALGFDKAIARSTGRPPYHPADMVGLILWGYLNGVTSSRRLEKACKSNIEVMWLLGKLAPDFWSIAAFQRTNTGAIRALFRQFARWCQQEDLFGGELVAVDGSKFRAVNSKDRNFTKKKTEHRLREIDRAIDRYLDTLAENDQNEEKAQTPRIDKEVLEEKIQRLRDRRSEILAMVEQMKQEGQDQVSLTDPESRSMKTGGGFNVCYNAQIAVDSKHGLIVTGDVTNAPNDLQQLSATAIEAKKILEVETLEVVADSGYSNASELAKCEAEGIEPYVGKVKSSPNAKKGLFTKYEFRYDPGTDTYTCPAEQVLHFSHQENRARNKKVRCYTTRACRECPIKSRCTTGKERRIRRSIDEDAITRADRRALAKPEVMKRRKELAEHPFGGIKRWINGGYFLRKGLVNVRAEFDLAALAFNMKRVISILGPEEFLRRLNPAV